MKAAQGGKEEASAVHCALCCTVKTKLRICAFPLSRQPGTSDYRQSSMQPTFRATPALTKQWSAFCAAHGNTDLYTFYKFSPKSKCVEVRKTEKVASGSMVRACPSSWQASEQDSNRETENFEST